MYSNSVGAILLFKPLVGLSERQKFYYLNWQIADPAAIEAMVDKVIADNPKQLEQYRAGKTKLQGFFAGQVCQLNTSTVYPCSFEVLSMIIFVSIDSR